MYGLSPKKIKFRAKCLFIVNDKTKIEILKNLLRPISSKGLRISFVEDPDSFLLSSLSQIFLYTILVIQHLLIIKCDF